MAADETTGLQTVELFLQCFYHLFLPIVLLTGAFCFAKSVIRSTKFYEGKERLDGKTIVITGGSNGLGRALAVELCRRGARVISACRTRLRRDSTAVFLREKTESFNHKVLYMDLNNLETVKNFARELINTEERIDVLINNAGIICDRDYTADGIDRMMGINYVGHFLLTNLLAEKLMTTPNGLGRVINVTGGSFTGGSLDDLRDLENKKKNQYDLRTVYRSSKLGLYLMNRELARRFSHFDICSLCVDPGLMNTEFYKSLPPPQNQLWSFIAKCMFRTPEEGMQSVLKAILQQDLQESSGMIIKDCEAFTPKEINWTDSVIEDIWNKTHELIRSKGVDLELGAAEGEEEDLGSAAYTQNVDIDLEKLTRLAKRSLTDDEEEGPQILPRPATPPRSNKTVHDEGDEVVDFVEFQSEEPPAVVRTTPSRQGSLEKRDKVAHLPVQEESEEDERVSSVEPLSSPDIPDDAYTPSPVPLSEKDLELPDYLLASKNFFEEEPLPENADIVEDLASDIQRIQEMLQEEESADLQRIEQMLREDGTPVDDATPSDEEGEEYVLHEPETDVIPEGNEDAGVADIQSLRSILEEQATSAVAHKSSIPRPSLESLPTEAPKSAPIESETLKPFDFSYDRRNTQLHNSLEDVKMRRLLLYPGKKRISLS